MVDDIPPPIRDLDISTATTAVAAAATTTTTPATSTKPTTNPTTRTDKEEYTTTNRFNYVLPRCELPPIEELRTVEKFVANAVQSWHDHDDDGSDSDSEGEEYEERKKNQATYQAILDTFRRTSAEDPPMIRNLLIALRTAGKGSTLHQLTTTCTGSGSSLASSKKHAHLIHLIFRLNPFIPGYALRRSLEEKEDDENDLETMNKIEELIQPYKDYTLADAFLHFIMALVSANIVFLIPAMRCLWNLLNYESDMPLERSQRLHAALATLTRLCPKGKTELFPLIASNFPFRRVDAARLLWSYKQCFQIIEYLPSVRGPLLQFVIDKCLEMDVEIKIHDGGAVSVDDETDDDEREDDEAIFQLDDVDNNEKKEQKDITVDEMADKLDSVMLLCLQHIESSVKQDKAEAAARELYAIISPVFESCILTTHKSKFVQFIIFFLCGIENQVLSSCDEYDHNDDMMTSTSGGLLYREFAGTLINIVLDPYRATITRQSAVCYLASFTSRASYVCTETVCECVCALLRWAEAYLGWLDSSSTFSTLSDKREQCDLHSLFYTICQAAFYIMCFRGKEAIEFYRHFIEDPLAECDDEQVDTQLIDIGPARWERLCCHELQPLRYCLESVRGEFLHVAQALNLLEECKLQELILEDQRFAGRDHSNNKRTPSKIRTAATIQKERQTGGVGGLGLGTNPLDSFFPFDPYLLRRSHGLIEPFYNHWSGSLEDETVTVDIDDDADDVDQDGNSVVVGETPIPECFEPMSYGTCATENEFISKMPLSHSGESLEEKPISQETPQEKWENILKRARAPSVENGSW